MQKQRSDRKGFSLVELLVVLGIMGLLFGITFPAVQKARGAAARLKCLNNLKQMGIALHSFHDTYGQLPPARVRRASTSDPNLLLSWMAMILPEMDQTPLFQISEQACRLDTNTLHNPPHVGLITVVPSYLCPADGRFSQPATDSFGVTAALTSYIGITGTLPPGAKIGLDGVLGDSRGKRLTDITDGTSQTIMVGERPPPDSLQAGWWYPIQFAYGEGFRGPNNGIILGGGSIYPGDPCVILKGTFGPGRASNPCDRYHLWSFHSGGANFLFADASARFLPYSAEPMMMALGSRSGGEFVDLP
jgi:prepilin-type N-terminal cleavage/methylation domain-containing protein/prepilin-type processing-associated H-X9-DG protein